MPGNLHGYSLRNACPYHVANRSSAQIVEDEAHIFRLFEQARDAALRATPQTTALALGSELAMPTHAAGIIGTQPVAATTTSALPRLRKTDSRA